MSQFINLNTENKLRIPLSGYAANIIESDCFSFSKKKTTLINSIIINSYQNAVCSISLRVNDLKNELSEYIKNTRSLNSKELIDTIANEHSKELVNKYAVRSNSDVNWQITLSKRVKELLTEDTLSSEEKYYNQKPGRYVRALLEEYATLPYFMREKIIFKPIMQNIEIAINCQYALKLTNQYGAHFFIKPHSIKTDPLSMFHYLIGYNIDHPSFTSETTASDKYSQVAGFRISRLLSADIQYYTSGKLTNNENETILKEIEAKGVQFLVGEKNIVQVWLSNEGIKRFSTQTNLRPNLLRKDNNDEHIFYFDCTEVQILFYFFQFGCDAKIINPPEIKEIFMKKYKEAYELYNT